MFMTVIISTIVFNVCCRRSRPVWVVHTCTLSNCVRFTWRRHSYTWHTWHTRLAPRTTTQQHCLALALPGSQSISRGERTNLAGSRDNEQRRAEIGGASN